MSFRFLLRPRWIALTLLIAVAVAGNESIVSGEPVKPEYFEF